jgi:hypothetical protein
MAMVNGWTNDFAAKSTGPVYQVTIAKTHHGHFSDLTLTLYRDYFRDSTWIDARRAHSIINAYTLAFFDQYLRHRRSELLQASGTPFPEVTFRRSDEASRP